MNAAGAPVAVLNGWAARPEAWSLCGFYSRAKIFSYIQQLDGEADAFVRAAPAKVVVAAWSMGCVNALRLAAECPDKIAGLVLAAATPRLSEDKATGWRGMSMRRIDALRKGLEATCGKGLFPRDPSMPQPFFLDTPGNLSRGEVFLREADVRAVVKDIPASMPVFIFQSERDAVVRRECGEWLAGRIPGAVLETVPGGEHALPLSMHAEITEKVEEIASGRIRKGGQ